MLCALRLCWACLARCVARQAGAALQSAVVGSRASVARRLARCRALGLAQFEQPPQTIATHGQSPHSAEQREGGEVRAGQPSWWRRGACGRFRCLCGLVPAARCICIWPFAASRVYLVVCPCTPPLVVGLGLCSRVDCRSHLAHCPRAGSPRRHPWPRARERDVVQFGLPVSTSQPH